MTKNTKDKQTADFLFGDGKKTMEIEYKANSIKTNANYYIFGDTLREIEAPNAYNRIKFKEELYSGLKSIPELENKAIVGKNLKLLQAYLKDFWDSERVVEIENSYKNIQFITVKFGKNAYIQFQVEKIDEEDLEDIKKRNPSFIVKDDGSNIIKFEGDAKDKDYIGLSGLVEYVGKVEYVDVDFWNLIFVANDGYAYATDKHIMKRYKIENESLYNKLKGKFIIPTIFNVMKKSKKYSFKIEEGLCLNLDASKGERIAYIFQSKFKKTIPFSFNTIQDFSKIDFEFIDVCVEKDKQIILYNKDYTEKVFNILNGDGLSIVLENIEDVNFHYTRFKMRKKYFTKLFKTGENYFYMSLDDAFKIDSLITKDKTILIKLDGKKP
jgi:hypothetical protein